ncbi:energy transducer TonB [Sphingobium boeckii]|uniref:Protein TonB n=1 Tax=Sphingobium boeckii TaxID=1082345 RepID=A0A7W9AJY5_9SPHN|nr:energy transducer TonB [Sphingobium boeckii]MBB5686846.1 protein TonB [Sphingobium boeckii]
MQNAGGYLDQKTRSPLSLGAAIAINGAMVAELLFASPDVVRDIPGIMRLTDPITVQPPPPDPITPPKAKTPQTPKSVTTASKAPPISEPLPNTISEQPYIQPTLPDLPGMGAGMTETVKPPRAPVLIGVRPDPRFADRMQPDYPPGLQRQGIEGMAEVRVLIGPDGRVRQIQMVSATEPAFFRATQQQALKYWRFQPATRDGVPIEGWRTMTVRFTLNDGR